MGLMSGFELAKVATNMGKVIKLLDGLESQIDTDSFFEVDDNKEDFFLIAYICRVGILDIIAATSWMQRDELPVTIPLGLFKTKKTSMGVALTMTVNRLVDMCAANNKINYLVRKILAKEDAFYEFEQALPPEVIKKIK